MKLLAAVLSKLSDPSLADAIAGDLEEQRRRHARVSRLRARLWFWRASLAVAAYVLVRRVVGALRSARLQPGVWGVGRGHHEWRQSLRSLRRAPWYSLTVTSVIALAMTLATTVFAIVDGVLFKPLPYPRAEELYVVSGPYSLAASSREIREWAAAVPEAQVAVRGQTFTIGATNDDTPAPVTGAEVGPGFLELLGARPLIGGFRPEHFLPSGGRIPAVISYRLWRRAFAADPGVLGRPLDLAGAANHMGVPLPGFQVVGVLPPDFVFPDGRDTPEIVLPLALTPEQDAERNDSAAMALVRIPGAVSPESVRARINAVAATQGFRDVNADMRAPGVAGDPGVWMHAVAPSLTLWTAGSFRIAFIAALVLVLIAGVNVAALALARGRQRRGELALRQALGASRWQLVRIALCETIPLVAIGTAAGIAGAHLLVRIVTGVMGRVALLKTPEVDWRVVAFAALTSAGLVLLVIAIASRSTLAGRLSQQIGRGATITARRGWSAFSLVTMQVALTMVLAIGGVLVTGSLWWVWQQDPGFDANHAALIEVSTGPGSVADRIARFSALVDRVRATPGVEQVATFGTQLLTRSYQVVSFKRPPGALRSHEQVVPIDVEFFSILGIHAVEGRLPTPEEWAADPTLAVVSEGVAHAYWPGQVAVGHLLEARTTTFRVVAVVRDARFATLDSKSYGQVYFPFRGVGIASALLIKSRGSTDATLRAVLAEVRSFGPPLGATRASSLDAAFGDTIRERSFYAWLFGGFAACALVIVGAGIVGLVAMTTATRTREIGIRMALGATRDAVVGLLLREQMRAVVIGILVGGLVAVWAVRYMKSYLYQFTVYDARLWAIAIATILITAGLGAIIPSFRASRIDPIKALRVE